ncbi:uncharacterized protein TRUGW13939_00942 [Talaromyces rugulosus]|uniref:Uncharacterized protein n=1 Tax=Talaromyces rugulosus TaxID=121627 RepID=A0A7H8QJN9_TALRU|nr:uncharacterized protein TRUGW13939_00942 [Talaromyces rugulosus]QKX53862.1 hypothetical protein TRUGW13939_00942 [Talaromyces rugulosus]
MKSQYTAAAGLLFALGAAADSTIASGEGFGTYYYDIKQVDACGTSFSSQNQGGVMCSSETLQSLDMLNTNYIVAMNNSQLRSDPSKYCGKKVVVTVNGKKSDMPLFIGDGCERCATGSSTSDTWNAQGAPGLDFSYSVLDELTGGSACETGHSAISWEILDESIHDFASGGSSDSTESSQGSTPTTLVTSAAPAATGESSACENNAWQCNGNVIEQCVNSAWNTRVSCAAGSTCKGDSNPYCA